MPRPKLPECIADSECSFLKAENDSASKVTSDSIERQFAWEEDEPRGRAARARHSAREETRDSVDGSDPDLARIIIGGWSRSPDFTRSRVIVWRGLYARSNVDRCKTPWSA